MEHSLWSSVAKEPSSHQLSVCYLFCFNAGGFHSSVIFLFVRFRGKHGDLGRRTNLGQRNTYLTLLCDWGGEMRARAPFAGESLCWKITAASIHKFGFGSDSFSCIYAGELDAVVCSLSSLPIHCVEKFALVHPHSYNLVQKIISALYYVVDYSWQQRKLIIVAPFEIRCSF
jgi:hypothetical protein